MCHPSLHMSRMHTARDNEIAIPAISKPKGHIMIVTETKRPTHRVYAVRKTGGDTSYWAEIGAAWANKDGKGFNLKLNLLPVGEADIVVREIQPKRQIVAGPPPNTVGISSRTQCTKTLSFTSPKWLSIPT